jgi:hypothetical protein
LSDFSHSQNQNGDASNLSTCLSFQSLWLWSLNSNFDSSITCMYSDSEIFK